MKGYSLDPVNANQVNAKDPIKNEAYGFGSML
jgi:hypothetical protein